MIGNGELALGDSVGLLHHQGRHVGDHRMGGRRQPRRLFDQL